MAVFKGGNGYQINMEHRVHVLYTVDIPKGRTGRDRISSWEDSSFELFHNGKGHQGIQKLLEYQINKTTARIGVQVHVGKEF